MQPDSAQTLVNKYIFEVADMKKPSPKLTALNPEYKCQLASQLGIAISYVY